MNFTSFLFKRPWQKETSNYIHGRLKQQISKTSLQDIKKDKVKYAQKTFNLQK